MPSEPVWFTVTEWIRLQSGSIHQNQWQWASTHHSTPTITVQINHLFHYGNHTLHQILTHLFLQYLFVGEIVDFHFAERLWILRLYVMCYEVKGIIHNGANDKQAIYSAIQAPLLVVHFSKIYLCWKPCCIQDKWISMLEAEIRMDIYIQGMLFSHFSFLCWNHTSSKYHSNLLF